MTLNRQIMNVIEGAHVMPATTQGLAAYHTTQAIKSAMRKRELLGRFNAVRHALNPYRVMVSMTGDGAIRIFRPETKQELFLGKSENA
jgi:hypothetical protein